MIGTMDVLCDELIDASATSDGEKVVAAEHQNAKMETGPAHESFNRDLRLINPLNKKSSK